LSTETADFEFVVLVLTSRWVAISDNVVGAPGLTPLNTAFGGTTELERLDALARLNLDVL